MFVRRVCWCLLCCSVFVCDCVAGVVFRCVVLCCFVLCVVVCFAFGVCGLC